MNRTIEMGWLKKSEIQEAVKLEWFSEHTFWNIKDFRAIFSRKSNIVPIVFRYNDKLRAFCIYEYNDYKYSILNLIVHPYHRRVGIGSLLIANLMNKVEHYHKNKIDIIIRDIKNDVAHLFLESLNFKFDGIRPNYYSVYDKIGNIVGSATGLSYVWRPREFSS